MLRIWNKVGNSIKKEIGTDPVCKEKFLKNKIKSYKGKINTKLSWRWDAKKGLVTFGDQSYWLALSFFHM